MRCWSNLEFAMDPQKVRKQKPAALRARAADAIHQNFLAAALRSVNLRVRCVPVTPGASRANDSGFRMFPETERGRSCTCF